MLLLIPPSDGGAAVNRSIIKRPRVRISKEIFEIGVGYGHKSNLHLFIMGNSTLYIYIAGRVV